MHSSVKVAITFFFLSFFVFAPLQAVLQNNGEQLKNVYTPFRPQTHTTFAMRSCQHCKPRMRRLAVVFIIS